MERRSFLMQAAILPFVRIARGATSERGKTQRVNSEVKEFKDPDTGARVLQLTSDGSDNVHLYFTSESFFGGGSDRVSSDPTAPGSSSSTCLKFVRGSWCSSRRAARAAAGVPAAGRPPVLFRRSDPARTQIGFTGRSRAVPRPGWLDAPSCHMHARWEVCGVLVSREARGKHGHRADLFHHGGDLLSASRLRDHAHPGERRPAGRGLGRAHVDQPRDHPSPPAEPDRVLPRGGPQCQPEDVDGRCVATDPPVPASLSAEAGRSVRS
jgi:hypothetical protein